MAAQYKPSDVVTIGKQSKTLNDWAAELGTPVQTILGRLKRNPSIEDACLKPVAKTGGSNKGQKADADVLAADEVRQLLDAGNKSETAKRDRALIVLAYRSGLRCSEILDLLIKDIDVERGTISVHHGKGNKSRVVALDPMAWAHLAEWLQLRTSWSIDQASPLFCTRQGKRIDSRQVRAMFARRSRKAKIEKHVHPHAMRRTMASEMAAEGIPLIDISGALGHANIATTNTYLKKVNPTSVIDAMKSRGWKSNQPQKMTSKTNDIVPPGWLNRLLIDIGDRLMLIHDGRTNENEFKAVVLLF